MLCEVIYLGNNIEVLRALENDSVDSIVTDPPYGLAFMGKKWDYDVPSEELWGECLRVLKPGGHLLAFGGTRTYHRMVVNIEDAGFEIRDQLQWIYASGFPKHKSHLKPANEPICLARKKGSGVLNIDECRIPCEPMKRPNGKPETEGWGLHTRKEEWNNTQGRWPANVLFDEEASELFGEKKRFFFCAKASTKERNRGCEGLPLKESGAYGEFAGDGRGRQTEHVPRTNHHPTVKPIMLMEYLVTLITPPGGTVLDPFMGSGTTGIAARNKGFEFIGIELDPEYFEIAQRRIAV